MTDCGMKKSCTNILIVDDEPSVLLGSSLMLRQAGFEDCRTLDDSRNLMPLLAKEEADVVVLDLQMPHLSGKELLNDIILTYPHIQVIIVTGANELETAIDCIKAGAFDYMVKPIEASRFVTSVRKAMEVRSMRREIDLLRRSLLEGNPANKEVFAEMRSRNQKMKAIFSYLEAIAPSDQPVLITGETGVGKELVARAIHKLSGRKGAFIAVNSAGLDDQMFADTLFGHRKGAFTGAEQARDGMITRAAGGTLFLDEIGEMTPASQVKLLRLLQEGEYFPLGSDLPAVNTARVVVATNRDLSADIGAGSFRRDLYYRLCSHRVHIPPLRERAEDIPLLIECFLREAAMTLNKEVPDSPPGVAAYLSSYGFPGNIRELRAMIFDAMTRHKGGILSMSTFREAIGSSIEQVNAKPLGLDGDLFNMPTCFPTLKEMEHKLIEEAMMRSAGNQRAAASLLGISRQALNQRLSKNN
jgi:DNA-binding NtrC family response regulator